MSYIQNQMYIPPSQVGTRQPVAASASLKSALRFFDVIKDKVIQGYSDPSPTGSMTIKGKTLTGDARYSAVGTFLLGQFLQDNSNVIEGISNTLAFETNIFKTVSNLF